MSDFYEELFYMGDFLWKMFSRTHPYHKLISFLVDNRTIQDENNRVPSLAYTCAKCEMSLKELEVQLEYIKERIDNYFFQSEKFDHELHPYLDLPFLGTIFFFSQEEEKAICLLKVQLKFEFQIGVPIQCSLFPGKYKEMHYQITAHLVKITYDGVFFVYYLKPEKDK